MVNVSFATDPGSDKPAVPERLGGNLGYFWFFSADNPEIFVKVVSACQTPFARVWFFASGLTNLGVRIHVTDRWSGLTKTYINPIGQPFGPIRTPVVFRVRLLEVAARETHSARNAAAGSILVTPRAGSQIATHRHRAQEQPDDA